MMKNLGVFFLTIALINSIIESKKDSNKSSNKHYAVSILNKLLKITIALLQYYIDVQANYCDYSISIISSLHRFK